MALIFDQKLKSIDSGVWAKFEDSEFLLASANNLKFQRELARLQAPHRRKADRGQLDPAIMKDILCEAMSKTIVLDWKNVQSTDGAQAAYSQENAYLALKNSDEFREFVQDYSTDLQNFKTIEREALGKS